jgi:hypothetical protein
MRSKGNPGNDEYYWLWGTKFVDMQPGTIVTSHILPWLFFMFLESPLARSAANRCYQWLDPSKTMHMGGELLRLVGCSVRLEWWWGNPECQQ